MNDEIIRCLECKKVVVSKQDLSTLGLCMECSPSKTTLGELLSYDFMKTATLAGGNDDEHLPMIIPKPELELSINAVVQIEALRAKLAEVTAERDKYYRGYMAMGHDVEQTLGKALGYPWYKDDQKNFPDATEKDGVCVGDHVPESLASEAASWIEKQRLLIDLLVISTGYYNKLAYRAGWDHGMHGMAFEKGVQAVKAYCVIMNLPYDEDINKIIKKEDKKG